MFNMQIDWYLLIHVQYAYIYQCLDTHVGHAHLLMLTHSMLSMDVLEL